MSNNAPLTPEFMLNTLVAHMKALEAEIVELRQHDKEATDLTIDQQVEIGRLTVENQRLLLDNAELSAECDQWQKKVDDCWREISALRSKMPS